ncbi:type VI secretion system Vgr family protein [Escherichia coli]|nr:type VI secretion system Vgr family protein [Escherichia coli]
MTIRSKTYKGSGFNELKFDDATGKEQAYIHAQKNMNTEVLNNRTTDVINNHAETIGNNQMIAVTNNQIKTVGVNQIETVGSNQIMRPPGPAAGAHQRRRQYCVECRIR